MTPGKSFGASDSSCIFGVLQSESELLRDSGFVPTR